MEQLSLVVNSTKAAAYHQRCRYQQHLPAAAPRISTRILRCSKPNLAAAAAAAIPAVTAAARPNPSLYKPATARPRLVNDRVVAAADGRVFSAEIISVDETAAAAVVEVEEEQEWVVRNA